MLNKMKLLSILDETTHFLNVLFAQSLIFDLQNRLNAKKRFCMQGPYCVVSELRLPWKYPRKAIKSLIKNQVLEKSNRVRDSPKTFIGDIFVEKHVQLDSCWITVDY